MAKITANFLDKSAAKCHKSSSELLMLYDFQIAVLTW